ncbi:glycerate kinase [Aldersonia sp. NBC_00410]|uniref:glycerate kinase n=1 Tax=Aldersonia sp. NBC_00410 TaxID=2975954 RepID=UPI00225AA856|nr:glycerate kinase [Aldersonia sp. NBC_00410]MCX5043010.1 glycerate kinase [Aldersonia sp. NBC_00410]
MRIVVAPDKFKGSLGAAGVAGALAAGIHAEQPDWTVVEVPVADGGDGTVDAFVAAGWSAVEVEVDGPTGVPHPARYARRGDTAVVELAAAVGLVALPDGRPDALGASTFGLGQLLAHALDNGVTEIVLGLGGSASTDGGAGMLTALGARVLDRSGAPLGRGGAALLDAAALDLGGLHPGTRSARFVLACDVDNPLLGPHGATFVYGPQKGADPDQLRILESAMMRWGGIVTAATGSDVSLTRGVGAAGGTGFGAVAVLGAQSRAGIDIVLDLIGFDDVVAGADLVITGEGSIDEQTLHGKAPVGVLAAARRANLPVLVVAGRSLLDESYFLAAGFDKLYTLTAREPDARRSMANAAELLRAVGRDIAAGLEPT